MKYCEIMGCLVIVGLVIMLVDPTDGHFTFFSPKEMREMMEKGKTGKSVDQQSASSEKQFQDMTNQVHADEQNTAQGTQEENGDQQASKQLDHVSQVGKILQEMLTDAEKVFSERPSPDQM